MKVLAKTLIFLRMGIYLSVAVCGWMFPGCSRKPSTEPIRIGHAAPLSGPGKGMGDSARKAILLAVEDANKDNHVLKRPITVDHADTQGDSSSAAVVVRRLFVVNRVTAFLGGTDMEQVDGLGAIAQSQHASFILSVSRAPRPTGDGIFRTGLPPVLQGKMLARHASEEMKLKRIALLSDGAPARSEVIDAFLNEFPKQGILGRWTYKDGDKLKGVIEDLRAQNPEAILFAGPAADCLALGKAGLDDKIPVLFAGEEGSLKPLQETPTSRIIYLTTAFVADDNTPTAKAFIDKYKDRFGELPDVHAALAYDNARLLFEAMRLSGTLEDSKIRDELSKIRFDGLTGSMSFDKERMAIRALFLIRLEGGQVKTIRRMEAESKK